MMSENFVKKAILIILPIFGFMALVKSINVFSYFVGSKIYPLFQGADPDNVFVVLILHHIIQALIALVIIYVLSRMLKVGLKDFGFNLNEYKFSTKTVLQFAAVWLVIQFGTGYMAVTSGASIDFGFPLNLRNFLGYFLFEILLSGTSEEIIFRALVVTMILYIWKKVFKSERSLAIAAILASTAIFMFDHINISFDPFQITHINYLQQLTCLVFGVFYGFLFVKTKSVLGPMLAHNILNGVITISTLILIFISG